MGEMLGVFGFRAAPSVTSCVERHTSVSADAFTDGGASMNSIADVLIAGRSTFEMTYA